MPYTPNNPYIPGDPYSYDLKWIICQLKEHTELLSTLDERISAAIISYLDQHDPVFFENAAALISSGINTEALAYIEGYYAPGDGGANLYYTTSDFNDVIDAPFYITLDGANRWALPIILSENITPRMFGAYGDDEHDDTDALNLTFREAFYYHKNVYIDAGTYQHTGITIYGAAFTGDEFTPVINGAGRNSVILKHTGSGVAVTVLPYENIRYVNGLTLSNFSIQGNDDTTIGLSLSSGTRYNIKKISVTNASEYGIRNSNNMWISSFEEIFIGSCATGISFRSASNTSLYLNECYVMYSSVYAYEIQAAYSDIGILAADYCTGTYVYYFYGFTGQIESLGCENCDVETITYFQASRISLGRVFCWNTTTDNNLLYPVRLHTSRVILDGIHLGASTSEAVSKPLAYLYESILDINAISGAQTYNAVVAAASGVNSVYTFHDVKYRPSNSVSGRSYIGVDRSLSDNLLPAAYKHGAAIILDCTQAPRYAADGTDFRYSTPAKAGDWFVENDPVTYGAAAYVALADGSSDSNALNYGFIPVMKAGTTANRPASTSLKPGSMYFDTTLGKPIWFKSGSTWVDATGASV